MRNPFDLTGKVALITGGNGGIGLGMAEALGNAGADLTIWGTNAQKNAAAKERLESTGRRILAQTVDVSDETQVVDAVKVVLERMGRLDVAIANAGINSGGRPLLETGREQFDAVIQVNLNGSMYLFREAVRHMVDRAKHGEPGGSLIAVSSLSGVRGFARSTGYSSSKAGMLGLVRTIAVEHGPDGIRANAIVPGWIDTDIISDAYRDKFRREMIPRLPIKRWGAPADFGGVVVYLASDASHFHTGDIFTVDGGASLV